TVVLAVSLLRAPAAAHPVLPSFPTRRSSDLRNGGLQRQPLVDDQRIARIASVEILDRRGAFGHVAERQRGERRHAVRHIVGLLRSEEHTSELQSRVDLVCRLLLEKKKKKTPL